MTRDTEYEFVWGRPIEPGETVFIQCYPTAPFKGLGLEVKKGQQLTIKGIQIGLRQQFIRSVPAELWATKGPIVLEIASVCALIELALFNNTEQTVDGFRGVISGVEAIPAGVDL